MRPLLLLGVAAVLAGCASTPADRGPLSAEAVLKDKEGKQVGVATMIQTPEGVRIAVTGYRLPPGGHPTSRPRARISIRATSSTGSRTRPGRTRAICRTWWWPRPVKAAST